MNTCNTPDSMCHVSASYSLLLPCHLLACCILSCHHVHCIAYVFVSCIRAFSPLSVLQFGTPMFPGAPFCLFSCASIKLSRNGLRFAKRPWYSTSRPPVKFRAIWRSFDTPTVNRVTIKPLSFCSPTPLPTAHQTHPNPLHALGRSITIMWAKTVPHLELPSSLYL